MKCDGEQGGEDAPAFFHERDTMKRKFQHKKMSLAVAAIAFAMCSWTVTGETNPTAAAATEVRTFRLQYASAKEVAEQINQLMSREVGPGGALLPVAVANAEANTVTVMAAPDKVAACGGIVSEVDKKPKQVYVEARFVALSSSVARNLGLKWNMLRDGVGVRSAQVGAGFSYQHIPEGVTKYSESVGGRGSSYSGNYEFDTKTATRSTTTAASAFDAKNNKVGETVSKVESVTSQGIWANTSYFQGTINSTDMQLLLQAFDDESDLKTFANPKIFVSSGKEATVDIATKSPYVEISAKRVVGDKNNTLDVDAKLSAIPGKDATFSGEVFFSFGIELKVLPRVLTNGLVNVVITPSITSLDPSANVVVRPSASESETDFNGMDIPHLTYPGIDMQRIITEFTMRSGETAVIGGLTRSIEQDQEDGIPYLRAIPWIGKWLFGSTSKVKSQEDVLVFVTVGEVDPEGVKGTTGAPAGSTAAKRYPEGLNTQEAKEDM